jgi:hypothetical protein
MLEEAADRGEAARPRCRRERQRALDAGASPFFSRPSRKFTRSVRSTSDAVSRPDAFMQARKLPRSLA